MFFAQFSEIADINKSVSDYFGYQLEMLIKEHPERFKKGEKSNIRGF